MTNTELLQLIEQAKTEGWTELDLSGQYLTDLPPTLGELQQLQALNLGWNKTTSRSNYLTALPEGLAQLTNLQSLDLGWNKLTALPEGLAQLTNLHSLDLNSNQLTALPEGLAQLTNLHSLDLNSNQLTALPEGLAQLTNLHSLDLNSNQLTALPEGLAQLTNLHSLRLGWNKLTALPEWLAQLTNLHSLHLRGNKLTALPEWLAQLTNLHSLDLNSNQLTALPEWLAQLTNLHSLHLSNNQLTALPEWLADPENLSQLRYLYIGENPLTAPPAEILGEALTNEYSRADIEAIRGYFRQLQEAAIYFYEAKLLIIGEGGAGKTSLARKLVEPGCQLLAGEKSTEGIAILTWQFALPPTLKNDTYTVNIWDFGGQEVYFATHQFFLTKRSVYILVADTRRQHTDFYTWLRMQETFGEDSPVLLIKNRNRQHGNSFTIENLPQLRERFPNLKEIIEIDLYEVPAGSGWQDLLHHVQDYLLRLPHIGQPRPSTWVAVRTAIGSDTRDIIDWAAFVTLCQAQGMQRAEDIQQLAEYLHNLGDILYFHEDPVLRDYVILKPTWGLDAVYKVLDNAVIEKRLGKFSRSDLRALWNSPVYTGYHVQLLRLMENFQLCYPLPDVKDSYIAPQLLTQEVPGYVWDERQNLQLRYDYPIFMPRGILSRAIVKLHERIEDQALVWRSGVILNDGYARAEVLELPGDKQIRVRVSGGNKRDLLMEIVRALDELHRGFPKLQFARLVPCHCATCSSRSEPYFFDLDILRERLANRKATIECRYSPYAEVQIQELLSEMQLWEPRAVERGDTKIYIERIYQGDHREGDQYDIGDISEVTGLALGKKAAATVINSSNTTNLGATKALTATEKIELDQLTVRKAALERPLRRWARVVKYIYGLAYIGLIALLWWLLDQLVRQQGWDTLEPITWIISTIAAVAAPLIVWLSAENLKPAAIEQWFFERWRAKRFVKHGFDSARYQALASKSKSE